MIGLVKDAQNFAAARQIPGPFKDCHNVKKRTKWIQEHLHVHDDRESGKPATRLFIIEHKEAAIKFLSDSGVPLEPPPPPVCLSAPAPQPLVVRAPT
eukprot:15839785-Heterocapsa_arctica.AAC.2